MSKVIAKFVCNGIQDNPGNEQKNVSFTAVTSGSDENKSFSKYTPSGSVNLCISYETEAANFFEEGEEYHLVFSKADKIK